MKSKQTNRFLNISSWGFSFKVTTMMVIMMSIMVIIVSLLARYNLKRTITDQVGSGFENTAKGIRMSLTEYLLIYVNQMATVAIHPDFQSELLDNAEKGTTRGLAPLVIKDDNQNTENSLKTPGILDEFIETYGDFVNVLVSDSDGKILARAGIVDNYREEKNDWLIRSWNEGVGGFYISRPEYDMDLEQVTLIIAFPVYANDNNEILGLIRAEIRAQNILFLLNEMRIGESGRAFLVDANGDYVIRKNQFNNLGDLNFASEDGETFMGNGIIENEDGEHLLYGYSKFRTGFVKNLPDNLHSGFIDATDELSWYVVFTQNEDEALVALDVAGRSIMISSIIFIFAFIVVIAIFIRLLLKPLYQIFDIGERVMEGDYSGELAIKSSDEIGKLSEMFNSLILSLREMSGTARKIANGDLSVEVSARSDKDEMGKAFELMVQSLRKQIGEINKVVSILTSSNSQLASTVSEISASSNETVTTVSEVSSTIDEVKQTSEVSAQKARNVSETANRSVQISEKGIRSTEDSLEGMEHIREQVMKIAETIVKLSEQSNTIGEITNAVNDLAEQSNLLAVNASIEAAKAGEYGKGFGVVAREIRNLADQSKQSTLQINTILAEVQKTISSAVMATENGGKAVERGVELAEISGDSISVLADSISEAALASTQIAASSHQQLAGLKELNTAMENIRKATEQNAEGNKDIERAVSNLKETINNLNLLISNYEL